MNFSNEPFHMTNSGRLQSALLNKPFSRINIEFSTIASDRICKHPRPQNVDCFYKPGPAIVWEITRFMRYLGGEWSMVNGQWSVLSCELPVGSG